MVSWAIRHTWMWGISACGVTVHVGWLPRTRCLLTPRQLNAFCFSAPGPHSMLSARMPFPGWKMNDFQDKNIEWGPGAHANIEWGPGGTFSIFNIGWGPGVAKVWHLSDCVWKSSRDNEWMTIYMRLFCLSGKLDVFSPTYFLLKYFFEKNWEFSVKIVNSRPIC